MTKVVGEEKVDVRKGACGGVLLRPSVGCGREVVWVWCA